MRPDGFDRKTGADLLEIGARAALEIHADEIAALAAEVQRVLAFVATLAELDDEALASSGRDDSTHLLLDDDIIAPSLSRRELLAQVSACADGFVVAPGFGAEL